MNQTPDRLLVDWLTDGPDRGPQHGLERTLAATRRSTQRPVWTFPSTWLPAPLAARSATTGRSFAILLAAALIAVALAATMLLVGSGRRAAPPFGLANNGPSSWTSTDGSGRPTPTGPNPARSPSRASAVAHPGLLADEPGSRT